MTTSVDPKNHAVWTLEFLYSRLCEWAYEFYDTTMHPALGQSPRDCFALGLQHSGNRPHRQIQYDDEFRMMTLPTTAKGTALVNCGKGIKINHLHYWSTVFRDPAVEGTLVPVRYDPYDAGTAYAYVGNHWASCYSEHFSSFRGRSEWEMMIAAAELRKRSHPDRKHKVFGMETRVFAVYNAASGQPGTQEGTDPVGRYRLCFLPKRKVFGPGD